MTLTDDCMDAEGVTAGLMVALAQITEGDARCEYCDQAATVTVATGADPDPLPCCWMHGRQLVSAATTFADSFFPYRSAEPVK